MNRAERRRLEKLSKKRAKKAPAGPTATSLQALLDTAVNHHNTGNLAQAEALYTQVLTEDPEQPVARHLLGVIAHQQGQLERAHSHISKAVTLRPDYTEAVFSLANVLQDQGDYEQARLHYQQALAQNPNHAGALNNLASTLDKMGHVEDAIGYLRRAIDADSMQVDSHKNLGLLLSKLNKHEEAVTAFETACKLAPQVAEHHFNLAEALQACDRLDQAISVFLKVLDLTPDHAQAHYRLGIAFEKMQALDKAEMHARRTLELAPRNPANRYPLAVLLRRQGKIEEALTLLQPAAGLGLGDTGAASVHFELGTLYDRSGDSQRAYEHFVRCNELNAASATVDKRRFLDKTARVQKAVDAWREGGTVGPVIDGAPIFIVGFPRSGTTLLDQVLDAHPGLQVMEEKPALNAVVRAIGQDYPGDVKNLGEQELVGLRQVYFDFVNQAMDRRPSLQLVDKLPLNIVDVPLITRLFPGARIILALRHPCDVVLSNFMQLFVLNDAMANFLTLADAAHCYAKVMGLWLTCQDRLALNHHTVRYEDLVTDLEGQARALLQFMNLPWHDAVLDPAAHARQRGRINTPSYQSVTEPLYLRAKGRWHRYRPQLDPHLDDLRPLIRAFGYEA